MVLSQKKFTPLFLSEIRPLWVKQILHLVPFPLPWRIFAINIGVFSLHCLSNIYVLFESATFYHDMGDIHHFLPCISYISVYIIPHICHFFYTHTFFVQKILHSKVREFTTKKASRQNSVNQYFV